MYEGKNLSIFSIELPIDNSIIHLFTPLSLETLISETFICGNNFSTSSCEDVDLILFTAFSSISSFFLILTRC